MSEKTDSLTPRVQESFRQLSAAAANLNEASDRLGEYVALLDEALKKLNLGVSARVTINADEAPDGTFWSREIGYEKISGKWGIVLITVSGNSNLGPDEEEGDKWPFNEAPRWLRIEGAEKIPELLENLAKETASTIQTLQATTQTVKQVVSAVTGIWAEQISREEKMKRQGAEATRPLERVKLNSNS